MNYFRNIDHQPLAIWNRSVLFFNISEDEGQEAAEEYAKGLTKQEKIDVINLVRDIKKRGYDVVRAELNRGLVLQEEEVA